MQLTIRKASVYDGADIFQLLQQLPPDENGFINSAAGKNYEEYRLWLERVVAAGQQKDLPVRPDLGRKVAVPTVHGHKQRVIPGNPDPA